MNKKTSKDLTTGPIWRKLWDLSAPMILGIIAVLSVNLVDTYFVAQLGTENLAAISFTFPVTFTIMSLAIGLSGGAASLVSRSIGAKDEEESKRLSTDSLVLSFLIVLFASVFGYFTITPLFQLIGAKNEVLDLLTQYMGIWYISMPFLVIPMVANALIRANGDAIWPSAIMILSALINIILTPMFIEGWTFIPAMAIKGAAVSTLISQMITFVMALMIVIFKEKMISFEIPPLSDTLRSWRKVLRIAGPSALGNMVNPASIGIVTAFIAGFGDVTVAAFGAATRIESFIVIPMLALSSAIGPISGQNWGAGNKDRVRLALKQTYIACFIWALISGVFVMLTSDWIARQFTHDPAVLKEITQYLIIIPLSLWGYGVSINAAASYNALGKPLWGLAYYLMRAGLFYVPLSFFAVHFYGHIEAVFWAIVLANVLGGVLIAFATLTKTNAEKPQGELSVA